MLLNFITKCFYHLESKKRSVIKQRNRKNTTEWGKKWEYLEKLAKDLIKSILLYLTYINFVSNIYSNQARLFLLHGDEGQMWRKVWLEDTPQQLWIRDRRSLGCVLMIVNWPLQQRSHLQTSFPLSYLLSFHENVGGNNWLPLVVTVPV